MELRHLRAFVAVAEELNFGRAAQRHHVTQPALSRTIRALEKLAGCELFQRNTRNVSLTPAGTALLEHARGMLTGLDAALTAARAAGGELSARMDRLWSPVQEALAGELVAMRAAFELMHAELPMPDGVDLAPVNAGGVPGIQLTPTGDSGTTVVYVHGGGCMMGSAYGYRGMAGAIAESAGARVLVPEYRLAPEHPFPAARDDALTAYRWLLHCGHSPEQLAVVGDSTGAMLVLVMLMRARDDGLPMPRAAVLLSPSVDLYAPADDLELQLRFRSAYLAGYSAADPEADPMNADLTGLPPMLVQSGEYDTVARHTGALIARLRAADVAVRHDTFDIGTHGFQLYWSFHPQAALAVAEVGEFLRAPVPSDARPPAPPRHRHGQGRRNRYRSPAAADPRSPARQRHPVDHCDIETPGILHRGPRC